MRGGTWFGLGQTAHRCLRLRSRRQVGCKAKWLTVSLDVDDLVADARARLTRGFTFAECATYQIENCPTTVEAIRNR